MTQEWRERLLRMDTGAVSDALDRLGLNGVVSGLRPLWTGGERVVGAAVTVRLVRDDGQPSSVHLGTRAIDVAAPGDVIAVDHRGRTEMAGWGGLLSAAAKARGVSGVVVDGAVRDVDDARAVGLPVYARGATPVTARGRVKEADYNQPIELGSVRVEPGDYIVADASGVVIIPRERLAEVIGLAEKIHSREQIMMDAILGGQPATSVMGQDYENLVKQSSSVPGDTTRVEGTDK